MNLNEENYLYFCAKLETKTQIKKKSIKKYNKNKNIIVFVTEDYNFYASYFIEEIEIFLKKQKYKRNRFIFPINQITTLMENNSDPTLQFLKTAYDQTKVFKDLANSIKLKPSQLNLTITSVEFPKKGIIVKRNNKELTIKLPKNIKDYTMTYFINKDILTFVNSENKLFISPYYKGAKKQLKIDKYKNKEFPSLITKDEIILDKDFKEQWQSKFIIF